MSTYSFLIESMIRGYRVYKDIWNDPDCDEVLECKREPGNSNCCAGVNIKYFVWP